MMVAEGVRTAAVKTVAYRARYDIDGPCARNARREVGIHRRDLELLDDFLREVLAGSARDVVQHVAAIHRYSSPPVIRAQDRNIELTVKLTSAGGRRRYAGRQHRQVQKVAPVQRQGINLLAPHDAIDLM